VTHRYASVARFVVAPPTDPAQLEAYERRKTAVTRRRVWRLWEAQLGLCRWCGQETYLHGDPRRYRPKTQALSGKAATLDHLHPKGDPRRYERRNYLRWVMACSTCNGSRRCDVFRAGLADLALRAAVLP
jgi:hypothetical protein